MSSCTMTGVPSVPPAKVAFVHNFATHYTQRTFELLAERIDADFFFFSGGRESYWLPEHGVRQEWGRLGCDRRRCTGTGFSDEGIRHGGPDSRWQTHGPVELSDSRAYYRLDFIDF